MYSSFDVSKCDCTSKILYGLCFALVDRHDFTKANTNSRTFVNHCIQIKFFFCSFFLGKGFSVEATKRSWKDLSDPSDGQRDVEKCPTGAMQPVAATYTNEQERADRSGIEAMQSAWFAAILRSFELRQHQHADHHHHVAQRQHQEEQHGIHALQSVKQTNNHSTTRKAAPVVKKKPPRAHVQMKRHPAVGQRQCMPLKPVEMIREDDSGTLVQTRPPPSGPRPPGNVKVGGRARMRTAPKEEEEEDLPSLRQSSIHSLPSLRSTRSSAVMPTPPPLLGDEEGEGDDEDDDGPYYYDDQEEEEEEEDEDQVPFADPARDSNCASEHTTYSSEDADWQSPYLLEALKAAHAVESNHLNVGPVAEGVSGAEGHCGDIVSPDHGEWRFTDPSPPSVAAVQSIVTLSKVSSGLAQLPSPPKKTVTLPKVDSPLYPSTSRGGSREVRRSKAAVTKAVLRRVIADLERREGSGDDAEEGLDVDNLNDDGSRGPRPPEESLHSAFLSGVAAQEERRRLRWVQLAATSAQTKTTTSHRQQPSTPQAHHLPSSPRQHAVRPWAFPLGRVARHPSTQLGLEERRVKSEAQSVFRLLTRDV